MNSAKRLILQNSFYLLLEKIVLMGGSLLLSVAIARYLGPEQFGRYNYLLSFTALFAPIFALGLTNILLREFAAKPDRIGDILKTSLVARFICGVFVTFVAVCCFFAVFSEQWKFQLLSLLLLANISNAFEVFERWFQHKSMNKHLVLWRVFNFTVFAVVKLVCVMHYQSFAMLVCIVALELLCKNIGYRVLYGRFDQQKQRRQYDNALFQEMFSQSRFLLFSAVASVIYLKIDILMLEALTNDKEVGIYSVAAKLSEIWYVLPKVVLTAMFPKMLEIAKNTKKRYLAILQRGFDLLFISALVLSMAVFFASDRIIDLLFGAQYAQSAAILQLHMFASLFIYMRLLLSQWLVAERFAEFSLFSQLSGAVANVLLNLWLIPLYGAWGAAVATLISYAVTTYFCLFFHARTRPIATMMTKAMLFPFRLHHILKFK